MCIYIYIYIYIHTYIHTFVYTHTHTHTPVGESSPVGESLPVGDALMIESRDCGSVGSGDAGGKSVARPARSREPSSRSQAGLYSPVIIQWGRGKLPIKTVYAIRFYPSDTCIYASLRESSGNNGIL